nr:BRCA1-associated RING domain protein 1-like [Hydra vulgaris]XP_047139202.1 BRCA1-associated RING domain protein 1-like [Hydra vulgaris]
MFTSIKENLIPNYNLNEDIDILELKNDLNPFLQLCLCCICNKIPQTPVSLKRCEHLFCFLCIVEKIKFKYLDETFCPKCNEKVFYDDLFTSKQTDSLLRMLTTVCSFCNSKFNLLKEYELYKSHKGICLKEASVPQSFAASISVNDVFKINENSDIPYEVEKAALHVIKQKMAKFGGKSVEFKSGGPRPIVFTQTPKAYVNSAQAAESTLRLRNTNILKHFETVAGNSCDSSISQTSKLLLSFEPDQRQSILSNTKLNHTKISANVVVAMKTDMGIPWEKLKVMSRWLKKYDITTASNASQRVVAENWSGNNIVENAPFTFKKEQKGKIEINEVP